MAVVCRESNNMLGGILKEKTTAKLLIVYLTLCKVAWISYRQRIKKLCKSPHDSCFSFPSTGTGNAVVIMVGYPKGMEILELVRRGIPVRMSIGVGKQHMQEYISGQSVVFVSIAFITMMIISLAWLIFFYIQRFLYSGSHFRNQVITWVILLLQFL